MTEFYQRLLCMLDEHGVDYRLMDHPSEGRTEAASRLRGHPLSAAAKSLVLEVATVRYVLAVVPGDARVDTRSIAKLYDATGVSLASPSTAERLSGCVIGSVVPFTFDPASLELVADPGLLRHDELVFNAARLDRSIAISTRDYLAVAKPRLELIADRRPQ